MTKENCILDELMKEFEKEFHFNSLGDKFLHISKSHFEYIVEKVKERHNET